MLKSLFNNVVDPETYFPVNLAKLLKVHAFYRTTPGVAIFWII